MIRYCLLLLGFLLVSGRFAAAGGFSGRVLETTNTAGCTYVQVDVGGRKLWAATTEFPVRVGDQVVVGAGEPMTGYHSQSLNRIIKIKFAFGAAVVEGCP